MMLQVRNCKVLALCALLLLAAGCEDKKEQPVDPYVTPGTTDNPNWQVTVENDMSSSMTAIVRVSFTDSVGTLAAFMDTACCGIAQYNSDHGLYWLYISPATEGGNDQSPISNVQLRFYSPDLKRIFDANETFPFRNDDKLGSIAAPYTPQWNVAE